MKKKKGKKKSKNSQIPQQRLRKSATTTTATTESVIDNEEDTASIDADNKSQAPPEMHFSDSDPEEKPGGENYDERLQEIMDPWRVLASEGRKEGHKSLSELLRELGHSDDADEGIGIALNAIKSTVTSLGIRLSRLIVEYFSIFWRYEAKEISAKTRSAANTIRQESLGENKSPSAIIDRFVAVIELVARGTRFPTHYNEHDEDDDDYEEEDHQVWVSKRENRILGTIFFRVLFLEIVFCFPFFANAAATSSEKKDSFEKIGEFVAKKSSFEEKLRSLESEISVLKMEELVNEKNLVCNEGLEYNEEDPETKRVKAMLGMKIEEIWKGLDKA